MTGRLIFGVLVLAVMGSAATSYRIPLSFERNMAQAPRGIRYLARAGRYTLALTATETQLSPGNVRLKWIGANSSAIATGLNEQPGKNNYFIGPDPAKWLTGIPTYQKVRFRNVYPGVDLVYYGNQRELEFDIVLAPGADLRRIVFAPEGAAKIATDANGDLILHVRGGMIHLRRPVVYQQDGQARRKVSGSYVLRRGRVGLRVGSYDPNRLLIIDPTLAYSTYLGGDAQDIGHGVAVDSSGNFYVTGSTSSVNFPIANALQTAKGGVSKTTDGGATWVAMSNGFTDPNVQALAIDPSSPSIVYAATFGGVLKTVNGGITWTPMNEGLTNLYVQSVAVDPRMPSTVYAGTLPASGLTGGVFKSTDGGANWTNVGLSTANVQALVLDSATPPSIYAATIGAIYKSTDAGTSWTSILSGGGFRAVIFEPSMPAVVYAGSSVGTGSNVPVRKSTDGGATWTPRNTGLPPSVFALALDPLNPSTLFAGTIGSIYKSTDGGGSWTATRAPGCLYRALAVNPVTPGTIYAACENGVFCSVDGGNQWAPASKGIILI